jgi:hypothetical protein
VHLGGDLCSLFTSDACTTFSVPFPPQPQGEGAGDQGDPDHDDAYGSQKRARLSDTDTADPEGDETDHDE